MSRLISRFPWIIPSSQAGGLMAAGDVISQTYIEKKNIRDINVFRTLRFGALGAFFISPTLGTWYAVMDKRIIFKSTGATALVKMTCDQGFFAPIFLAVFISVNGTVSRKPWRQVKYELRRDYKEILISNYKLWPAVQLLNFWVVPPQYRILFVQSVALLWNTYLSWMTNQDEVLEIVQ